MKPSINRLKTDIEYLAENYTDRNIPGYTRRAFTPEYKKAREWLEEKMRKAGLQTGYDNSANLIGRLEGINKNLKPIIIGSHIDTVRCGGRFDGILGVIAGLEIVRTLRENNINLAHPLEIIDFTSEEPSEFGVSTIGSRGMTGNLSQDMLQRKDPEDRILADLINECGGNTGKINENPRNKGDIALYLEIHIEQGPVLENENKKIGVVTGISGIQRFRAEVFGAQNHAGTTPMNLRKDALTSSSELVLELEKLAKAYSKNEHLVATVGKMNIEPNAANIIPGKCCFDLEVRSLNTNKIISLIDKFKQKISKIQKDRDIKINFENISVSEPVIIDKKIQEILYKNSFKVTETIYIQSGAGHDANQVSKIAPAGMLFVPSIDGRSHCPEENTNYEDIAVGTESLMLSLLDFDKELQIKD